MASAIVGRETELEAGERFLDGLSAGPAAFVIEGEAGIGKTTIWLAAKRSAQARSFRVIEARPAQNEASLSYAALADLLGDAFDETRTALPAPQDRALATALLRSEANEPADVRTTAAALVGVLTALAAETTLLIAIDDVQWLDQASARALEFAVRRLPPRAGLLLTHRTDGHADVPLGLGRALPPDRVYRCGCRPLSLAALHHMIADRGGAPASRSTLVRIAAACGGNPFFALEIVQALGHDVAERGLAEPLPVPASLQELAVARMRALPAAAREVVLVAASLSRPTVSAVSAALTSGSDTLSALLAAEEAGVLVCDRERIRFTHPLLASGVYNTMSHPRRRQLHRHLAEVVDDPEERARHLAVSVTQPDEPTAAAIEHAARQAAVRGAHNAAAELFEAARGMTPADRHEGSVRRTLGQAFALRQLGDLASARSLTESLLDDGLPCAVEIQKQALLAGISWDEGATQSAVSHLERALAAAREDPELSPPILTRLVSMSVTVDPARTIEHAAAAIPLLSRERDQQLLASVLIDEFFAEALLGKGARRDLLNRGLELEAAAERSAFPHPIPLIWFQCVDDVEATRARHADDDQWCRDHGHERGGGERLGYLSLVELRAGRWEIAEQHAERSCNAIELDASGPWALPLAWRSLVDAYRGRFERAQATLRPLIEETDRTEKAWWAAFLLDVQGFVEFAAGNHEAADRALTRMHELFDAIGVTDGLLDRSEPFHIECLLALGQVDRAHKVLDRLEERGRALPRLWIKVTLPRARALVLAAEDNFEGALTALEELDTAEASRLPFELACALLTKGRLLRRLKQRRAAAAALGEALNLYERLGAPTWVSQTQNELVHVGPRRRSPDGLTATELRVAELAASGLTNREVAKAAFMSPKTVEANLARIYRKLGIRSRAELGAQMHHQSGRAAPRT